MNITEAAKSLNEAQIAFDKEWHKYFASVSPLSRGRFWEMLPYLTENLQYGEKKLNSKNACREFFRKSEYDERYTFDDAVRFAKTWEVYKSDLRDSPHFAEIEFGKGDDSYGDLIDSLPLAGGEFMGRCLVGDFSGESEFVQELNKASCLGRYIYDGENYFEMFLEDNAKTYFLYRMN